MTQMMIIPEEVEKKAAAAYEAASIDIRGKLNHWEEAPLEVRNHWRIRALVQELNRWKKR